MAVGCAVQIEEASSVLQNIILSAEDTLAVQALDSLLAGSTLHPADVVECAASELVTTFQALTVSDDVITTLSEDQVSSLPTAASDEVATSLSDAASVGVVFTSIDDLIAQLEEVGGKIHIEDAIPKSAQDDVSVPVEEGAVTELAGPYWTIATEQEYGLVYADSYQLGRREDPGKTRW